MIRLFRLIEVSTEERIESATCIEQFSVLFGLIHRSTEKILDSFLNSIGDNNKRDKEIEICLLFFIFLYFLSKNASVIHVFFVSCSFFQYKFVTPLTSMVVVKPKKKDVPDLKTDDGQ